MQGARAIADHRRARRYGLWREHRLRLLANTHPSPPISKQLQRNLVLSHACGTGAPLSDEVVRLVLVLKIASLSRGASGVRARRCARCRRLVEAEVYPCIPVQGLGRRIGRSGAAGASGGGAARRRRRCA
jgi:histidine ammonia-lyase